MFPNLSLGQDAATTRDIEATNHGPKLGKIFHFSITAREVKETSYYILDMFSLLTLYSSRIQRGSCHTIKEISP